MKIFKIINKIINKIKIIHGLSLEFLFFLFYDRTF